MTRAEQRALEAYPIKMTPLVYQDLIDQFGGKTEIDVNTYPRCLFQQGYEQAEKDLALTWEDIRTIINIGIEMINDPEAHPEWMEEQPFSEEVLRRFNKAKEERNEQH